MIKDSGQQTIPGAFARARMSPSDVKEARRALGLSVIELAVVLGVKPRTVNKWESSTGCVGAARELLRLLVRHPGILYLLGINFPARPPIAKEVGDEDGVPRDVPEVQSPGSD